MTQEQRILERLKLGFALTPLDALHRFGCFRLSARILDLKRQGHDIATESAKIHGKRIASYRLKPKPRS